MNEALNKLPSVKNMIKLIIVLLLGLISLSLVIAIAKLLIPVLIVGLLILGGIYLFRSLSSSEKAKRTL